MEQFIAQDFPIDAKVYQSAESGMMSILDMLDYFEKYGVMRVSDLHIKVGVQPAYRIDGNLVKLKGAAVTPEIIKGSFIPAFDRGKSRKTEYRIERRLLLSLQSDSFPHKCL